MAQIVIKTEEPHILTEKFFKAGLFVVEDFGDGHIGEDPFITSFNMTTEEMLLISLYTGEKLPYNDNSYSRFIILKRGAVLEITV